MIIVLHGDDTASSYRKLTQILEGYKDNLKVRLSKATQHELEENIFSQDLIAQNKVIIVENFLSPLKKIPTFLENVPQQEVLIFWEKTQLSPAKIQKLQKIAKVEFFKENSRIFAFLDSLFPGSKQAILSLQSVSDENLLWHVEHRFLLLVLSKLNFDSETASRISGRNIFEWQWSKIRNQAARFSLEKLLALYNGALKIDYLIKTGKTQLSPDSLVSILLLKYLTR